MDKRSQAGVSKSWLTERPSSLLTGARRGFPDGSSGEESMPAVQVMQET